MHTINLNLSQFKQPDLWLSVLDSCQQKSIKIKKIAFSQSPTHHLILSMQCDTYDFSSLFTAIEKQSINENFELKQEIESITYSENERVDYVFTVMAENITPQNIIKINEFLTQSGFSVANIKTRTLLGQSSHQAVEFGLIGEFDDEAAFHSLQRGLSDDLSVDFAMQSYELFHRQWQLACFDMDSTLIQVEVIDELAKAAGIGQQVSEITERAMRGELDFKESFRERLALLEGLPETVLSGIAQSLPFSPGVEALLAGLKSRGIKMAILSGGFQYFAKYLQDRLGFDYIFANELEISQGKVTGVVKGEVVDADRKALLLNQLAQENGIAADHVIAVGDGANDLKMLDQAGLGIAFRAKPIVRDKAAFAISTLGLDAALYLLPEE